MNHYHSRLLQDTVIPLFILGSPLPPGNSILSTGCPLLYNLWYAAEDGAEGAALAGLWTGMECGQTQDDHLDHHQRVP